MPTTAKTTRSGKVLRPSERTGSIRWMDLNRVLRETEDEKLLHKLLDDERKGLNRPGWVIRIHQRLNRVRCLREQKELLQPRK